MYSPSQLSLSIPTISEPLDTTMAHSGAALHNGVTCSVEVQLFPSPSFLIHRLVVGVGFFYPLFILQAPFGHIDASSKLCMPGNYGSRDSANLHPSQSF